MNKTSSFPSHTSYFSPLSASMIEVCRAEDFDFFLPFIEAGKLTVVQMYQAAERYRLGKTKSGQPMFWMINDKMEPLDAHIANSTWLSTLLKAREPELLECWRVKHCLFGQHLLSTPSTPVCMVESEKTAVVLSELFPESLWMAYVSILNLDISLFAPLQGRTVVLFPPTEPTFSTFLFFDELVTSVRRHYNIHIVVNSILEDYATDDQKERCIDLLDFILEKQSQTNQ